MNYVANIQYNLDIKTINFCFFIILNIFSLFGAHQKLYGIIEMTFVVALIQSMQDSFPERVVPGWLRKHI